jgi:hypothetical protein
MSKVQPQKPKIFCKCCLKLLTPDDSRIPVTQKTRDIFFKFISIPIKDGVLCSKCNINLLTFDSFQREVRRKHSLVAVFEKGEEIKANKQENNFNNEQQHPAKKIKQEDPLEITDGGSSSVIQYKIVPTENQSKLINYNSTPINHKSFLIGSDGRPLINRTLNHKSFPVISRSKIRYDQNDLKKLREGRALAASIKIQVR